jgi:hypothetical protein
MPKVCTFLAALLWLTLSSAAQSPLLPDHASLRYSEQVSNSPAGNSECFTMQGVATDVYWKIAPFSPATNLGLAIDVAMENTRNINHTGYGLNLFSFTAGPRLKFSTHKLHPFAQALFGLAHGWGSEFPLGGNTLTTSANAFALDLGAGADYPLNTRLSLRVLQADYLRTTFPNNVNDRQNNLRIGFGLTLRLLH